MPYIPPDLVAQVKEIDLLTYLQNYDPEELVHVAGNEYSTKTHDSLKISNGLWKWNSRDIGGKSALDYLIKVRGMGFLEAVETILRVAPQIPSPALAGGSNEPPAFSLPKERHLLLPAAAPNNDRVIVYLVGRGIDRAVLEHCIGSGQLYQSADHGNCVFVGMDTTGQPRYAALRGTIGSFKGEARGSDKRFSFSLPAQNESNILHLYESAIDTLSYATLLKMHGRDWQQTHLLSLAGVGSNTRLPPALARYLEDYPGIQRIDLHLDNDLAGRTATQNITDLLGETLEVRNRSPPTGKDVNAYLMARFGLSERRNNRDVRIC